MDGKLYMWGEDGEPSVTDAPPEVLSGAQAMAAGYQWSMAIDASGRVRCT
jgi:hypothetical protein